MPQHDITKEQFADAITGRTVRTIEFGDSDPGEIAIHLSDGETLFIGAQTDVSMSEIKPLLYFERWTFIIEGTAERIP